MVYQASHAEGFKDREREVGTAIEEVAKDSCHKWKLEEQTIELELTGILVYNSSSGYGLAVLLATDTGKCIDFATRNKDCRFCSVPAHKRAQPNSLRLQKKFFGLLKSNGIVRF